MSYGVAVEHHGVQGHVGGDDAMGPCMDPGLI